MYSGMLVLSVAVQVAPLPQVQAECEGARGRLRLTEIRSYALPQSFAWLGSTVAPSGATLLWSAQPQSYLILVTAEGQLRRVIPRRPLPVHTGAALADGGWRIDVVDPAVPAVLSLDAAGTVIDSQPIRAPGLQGRIVEARLAGNSWFIGVLETPTEYAVYRSDPGSAATKVYARPLDRNATPARPGVRLGHVDTGVTLSLTRPPFETVVLTRSGTVRARLSLRSARSRGSTLSSLGDEIEEWTALPALPLDSGFIQTFSHLKSDRRILVMYGADGAELRHVVMNTPLGLLESLPARRLVVGARATGRSRELVVYRWCWTRQVSDSH